MKQSKCQGFEAQVMALSLLFQGHREARPYRVEFVAVLLLQGSNRYAVVHSMKHLTSLLLLGLVATSVGFSSCSG